MIEALSEGGAAGGKVYGRSGPFVHQLLFNRSPWAPLWDRQGQTDDPLPMTAGSFSLIVSSHVGTQSYLQKVLPEAPLHCLPKMKRF